MRRSVLLTALAPMTWGTTYAVTTELLPPERPLLAAALRALPAGVLIVIATGILPSGRWWWRSLVLGALNFAAFFALLFTAAYRLPGGVAATVGAIQPLVVLTLAALVLGERPDRRRVGAGLAGIGGVALLVVDGGAQVDAVGVLAALGAATSMATGSILVQRWGRPTSPVTFAGWQLAAGGLLLAPTALLVEGLPNTLTAQNMAGYVYLASLGGALAYTLWFRGIGKLGARDATFLSLLSPVVATLVGFVIGDQLTPLQLLGAGVVVASVVTVQRLRAGAPARPGADHPDAPSPLSAGEPLVHAARLAASPTR